MRMTMYLLTALLMIVIGMVICAGLSSDEKSALGLAAGTTGEARGIAPKPLYLALIPERDIFAQRHRYQALADNIALHMGQPVELVSLNTYQSVLDEFEANRIDGAFVGSMLAVLAHDRLGAQVLVKPEHTDGISTYTGVIIVPADSKIKTIADLAGQSVAMVRTTTAGCLYPVFLFHQADLFKDSTTRPQFRWVGTHDQVIREVLAGTVQAGAVKNLRLLDYEMDHPDVKLVRLAESQAVADNGLIVRADMDVKIKNQLAQILLSMDKNEAGRKALATFGARRFMPCSIQDYHAVYEMVRAIGTTWDQLGVTGNPPVMEQQPVVAPSAGE